MKKLIVSTLLILTLTACAAGITDEAPVKAGQNIQNLCIKGNFSATPENFLTAITTSLNKKGITLLKSVKNNYQDCSYLMQVRAKGNKKILANTKINVIDLTNGKKTIGSVTYKRRGDEKERVKAVGLQGQTDMIINSLFRYY